MLRKDRKSLAQFVMKTMPVLNVVSSPPFFVFCVFFLLWPPFALDHPHYWWYWPIVPQDKFKSYLFNIRIFCCLIFKQCLIYFLIN